MRGLIFIIYGHHNTKDSFNAEIRNTFIEEAKSRNINRKSLNK